MRVTATPWARAAMDDEVREYIDQEDIGDDGSTLSLLARSARGPFIARLYDPELGEKHVIDVTLAGAIRAVIAEIHA